MDLKDKIVKILSQTLHPEYVRLEEDDGISGFVVSRAFDGMPTLDRQAKLDEILRKALVAREDLRQVLMIAALTPEEYQAVGVRVRVHRITERPGRGIEVLLQGGLSDAEYVRRALDNQEGVHSTNPKTVIGASGTLMSFRAKGTSGNPLTKEKAVRLLKKDQYIEVMSNA